MPHEVKHMRKQPETDRTCFSSPKGGATINSLLLVIYNCVFLKSIISNNTEKLIGNVCLILLFCLFSCNILPITWMQITSKHDIHEAGGKQIWEEIPVWSRGCDSGLCFVWLTWWECAKTQGCIWTFCLSCSDPHMPWLETDLAFRGVTRAGHLTHLNGAKWTSAAGSVWSSFQLSSISY